MSIRIIIIKNVDSVSHTYCGMEIVAEGQYTIQEEELSEWQSCSALISDIGSEIVVVNNGDSDFTDVNEAVNWLKGNDLTGDVTLSGVDVTSIEKALKVNVIAPEGSSSILISQNFCDKTTWYGGSTRVTAEELEADFLHLNFTSDHAYWIDLSHGKVAYEDRYISTYAPKIYVDGSEVTSGFSINYESGVVTFDSSKVGHTVTATYSYAVDNLWKVEATQGKIMKLKRTYVKITDDVNFPSGVGIAFQVFMTINGVPDILVAQTLYKTLSDFLICASNIERVEKWSTMSNDLITIYFDYVTSKELAYSSGTYIKIGTYKYVNGQMVHTDKFNGTFGHAVAELISLSE